MTTSKKKLNILDPLQSCSHRFEDLKYPAYIMPEGYSEEIKPGQTLCTRNAVMGRYGYNAICISAGVFYLNPIDCNDVLFEFNKYKTGLVKTDDIFKTLTINERPWTTTFYVREQTKAEKEAMKYIHGLPFDGNILYPTSYGRRNGSYFLSMGKDNHIGNMEDRVQLPKEICTVLLDKDIKAKKEEQIRYAAIGGTVVTTTNKGMGKIEVPNGSLQHFKYAEIITPSGSVIKSESYGSGRNFGYSYKKVGEVSLEEINMEDYYVLKSENKDSITEIFGCRNGSPDYFGDH